MEKVLNFKWTVSRGQNTYGYNICSLFVDGKKVSSCNGGGYDMQGTALAEFLTNNFQDRLLKIKRSEIASIYTIKNKQYNLINRDNKGSLYGSYLYIDKDTKTKKVSLDGACGFDSIKKIAEKIGITLKFIESKSNYKTYLMIDKKEK